jgi:hypothetical protein
MGCIDYVESDNDTVRSEERKGTRYSLLQSRTASKFLEWGQKPGEVRPY